MAAENSETKLARILLAISTLAVGAIAGFVIATQGAGDAQPRDPIVRATVRERPSNLLPDLQTLPPTGLYLERDEDKGLRLLRFANTTWNAGPGPLEIYGELDDSGERDNVTQRIYEANGESWDRPMGQFVYHEGHDHVHVEDFASYEVWSLPTGGASETLLATTAKVTYCVMNTTDLGGIEGGKPSDYGCNREKQGISPGWGDTYGAALPGQEVNIEALPDGVYALRSIADPQDQIIEMDETNNSSVRLFELRNRGTQVVELHGDPPLG